MEERGEPQEFHEVGSASLELSKKRQHPRSGRLYRSEAMWRIRVEHSALNRRRDWRLFRVLK